MTTDHAAPPTGTPRAAPTQRHLGLALVLLATLLACLPVLGNGFAQDGKLLVMVEGNDRPPNAMVATLQPVGAYFTAEYWHGAAPSAGLYRPMTVLSFALVRHGIGVPLDDPALAQHLVDLLLHLLATALVWRMLRWLGMGLRATVLGAACFGLHAIHAEAIASVVGRAELMGFVGGLGGTLFAARAERGVGGRRLAAGVGAALCFFAAFASKESALPWVAFAPLLLWVAARGHGRGRAAVVSGLLCALPPALVFLLLRAHVLSSGAAPLSVLHAVNPLVDVDAATRIATATVAWAYGAFKLLWPVWLVSDYGGQTFTLRGSLLTPAAASAALLLVGSLVGTLAALRRAPILFLAGACFLGFSALTSNVPFVIGTLFAERLYYTPSLAAALALAWLGDRRLPGWGVFAAGAWLAFSAWLLADRLRDWRDDATLLLHDVAVNPDATRLHTAAAEVLRARGELEAACDHTRRALDLDPDFAGAWSNLGALLLERGRNDEAEAALRRGMTARRQSGAEQRFLLTNLGRALLAQGRPQEALTTLEPLHRVDPGFGPALVVMLDAAGRLGDEVRVRALLATGEQVAPGELVWALHRGLAALRAGDAAAAERELRAALAGMPDDARARAALADALRRQGRAP